MAKGKHKFWLDYFELKNGLIKVFRRRGVSARFYARFTFLGQRGYVQESLGTADKDLASQTAVERYLQYEFRLKQGLLLKSRKFKEVSAEYIQHLLDQVKRAEIKERKYHGQKLMLARYFDDYFGEMNIGDIQKKEIDGYREWRKNYWISGRGAKERFVTYTRNNGTVVKAKISTVNKGRVARSSTVNNEETVLRSVFKFAVMKGYISAGEMVQVKTPRVSWTARSTFSEREFMKLLAIARRRIKEAEDEKREREAYLRFLLYQYILIASNCGARVTELMNIRWRDIEWHARGTDGSESIIISVAGKSKSRELVAMDSCREYLTRILDRQKANAEKYGFEFGAHEEFIFSDMRGRKIHSFKANFENLMEECALTRDNKGLKRSLGSLRIYYCTLRLIKGDNVDLYDLALNMGTSVAMLQRTYSRLTARLKAHKIKSIRKYERQDAEAK